MQQGTDLQNKRVVILGGSSGIGLAVAEQAASQGANIVIASSNAERVQKAVESVGENGQGQTVDLSDEQYVESTGDRKLARDGGAARRKRLMQRSARISHQPPTLGTAPSPTDNCPPHSMASLSPSTESPVTSAPLKSTCWFRISRRLH